MNRDLFYFRKRLGIEKLAYHIHLVLYGDRDSLKHMAVFFKVMVVGVGQGTKEP